MINQAIGGEALFIDTVFSPWTTARRLSGREGLKKARSLYPELVLEAMDSIATSLAAYAKGAVSRGAAGIFFSVGAASEDVMTADEYKVWGRPFDLMVLEAVREADFNVLHIHGKRIMFDSLIDYPSNAINWSHFAAGPSLKEGLDCAGRTVMGGIDETEAAHSSPPEIAAQIEEAIREVGTRGLIITPGCSVPTDTPQRNLEAIRFAVERISV
jgi:uroporphyrinogen decarboxylase